MPIPIVKMVTFRAGEFGTGEWDKNFIKRYRKKNLSLLISLLVRGRGILVTMVISLVLTVLPVNFAAKFFNNFSDGLDRRRAEFESIAWARAEIFDIYNFKSNMEHESVAKLRLAGNFTEWGYQSSDDERKYIRDEEMYDIKVNPKNFDKRLDEHHEKITSQQKKNSRGSRNINCNFRQNCEPASKKLGVEPSPLSGRQVAATDILGNDWSIAQSLGKYDSRFWQDYCRCGFSPDCENINRGE